MRKNYIDGFEVETIRRPNGMIYHKRIEKKENLELLTPEQAQRATVPNTRISVDNSVNAYDFTSGGIFEGFYKTPEHFDPQILEVIANLSVYNADVSQAISNIEELGNSGHSLNIEANRDSELETLINEANEYLNIVGAGHGGFDGFVNSLFAQVARYGTTSIEYVVEESLDAIKEAVFVPVKDIKFFYDKETKRYVPKQKVSNPALYNLDSSSQDYIELNELTYLYLPLKKLDSSPYALPPMLGALDALLMQKDALANYKMYLKKLGILGFITVLIDKPDPIPGETEDAYAARLKDKLQVAADNFNYNYRDGVAMGYSDELDIEHHDVSKGANDAGRTMQIIEEQVASGLKTDPALLGRTYSTTETYAGVVYEKLLSQIKNYQRIVSSAVEYGLRLHLTLKGYTYKDIELIFDEPQSLSNERDEAAYATKITSLKQLYNDGIISQEQYAQEAGYDSPYLSEEEVEEKKRSKAPADVSEDEDQIEEDTEEDIDKENDGELVKIKLIYNKAGNSYKWRRKKKKKKTSYIVDVFSKQPKKLNYDTLTNYDRIFDSLEKTDLINAKSCENSQHLQSKISFVSKEQKQLDEFSKAYFRKIYPKLKGQTRIAIEEAFEEILSLDLDTMDADVFADLLVKLVNEGFEIRAVRNFSAISSQIKEMYSWYRFEDPQLVNNLNGREDRIKKVFSALDTKAIQFMSDSDTFYAGRYFSDPKSSEKLRKFVKREFIKDGVSIRDRGEMARFKKKFSDRVDLEDYKIRRVVETTTNRSRNWGNFTTYEQGGVREIQIVGPADQLTCDWCKAMVNTKRTFTVSKISDHIRQVTNSNPEELPLLNPFLTSKVDHKNIGTISEDEFLALGIALPPYHPHCRHRYFAVSFEDDE